MRSGRALSILWPFSDAKICWKTTDGRLWVFRYLAKAGSAASKFPLLSASYAAGTSASGVPAVSFDQSASASLASFGAAERLAIAKALRAMPGFPVFFASSISVRKADPD